MTVVRSPHNPLIVPEQVTPSASGLRVVGVFNAGALRRDGEVLLLLRVAEAAEPSNPGEVAVPFYDSVSGQSAVRRFRRDDPGLDLSDPRWVGTPQGRFLTSISHLRLARSLDGIHFKIVRRPALSPADFYEQFGLEDARITSLDGRFYISYSAVSPAGVTVCLASTLDFHRYTRHGVMALPDNKDVVLFPQRMGGSAFALCRPASAEMGRRDMWLGASPDLVHWGAFRLLLTPRPGLWDSERVGAGAVPIPLHQGWLVIYHGADQSNRYCLGALLLHAQRPWEVLGRSVEPILTPEAEYERIGFCDNVVFTCGALMQGETVRVYYGAADRCIASADLSLDAILGGLAPEAPAPWAHAAGRRAPSTIRY